MFFSKFTLHPTLILFITARLKNVSLLDLSETNMMYLTHACIYIIELKSKFSKFSKFFFFFLKPLKRLIVKI